MISEETIKKALTLIEKRTTNYEYFFRQLKSADWIIPFKNKGYFSKPPEPIKNGDYIRITISRSYRFRSSR